MSRQGPDVALLLVDLQHDFLARPGLTPDPAHIVARAARLLEGARRCGVPVAHAHTVVRADGTDRMPHWKRDDRRECVEGTAGAAPPAALLPRGEELVLLKRYFSPFGDSRLEPWLRQHRVRRLLVAGIYLESCVRSAVLDAYERGYEVSVATDAVGSLDVVHGEIARQYLSARAASFQLVDEILRDLGDVGVKSPAAATLPGAIIAGERRASPSTCFVHGDPCRTGETLAAVPLGGGVEVQAAAAACTEASRAWAAESVAARAELLDRWGEELEGRRGELIDLIVREQAKPRRFAEEEVGRAVAHVRIAAELTRQPSSWSSRVAPGVAARQRPLGVVGLVTPWNNPLAIAVGKLAPALAFGNAAVWKPSPRAGLVALAAYEALERAGLPPGLVNLVFGDAEAAAALCRDARIAAVAATGSLATGRVLAALCAQAPKPLQAELGGNNAAIVLADADLEGEMPGLVRAAFGFAGQRCTAVRRFVVERGAAARFEALANAATESLRNGSPGDPETEVGPLISAEKRDEVVAAIEAAQARGARLVTGGRIPRGLESGAWLEPALLADVGPHDTLAQTETFGPLAVILVADDLEHAVSIANGVAQGLVAAVHTSDAGARARLRDAAEAGILHLRSGPLAVHPRAPFTGWKQSGLGPPEHGIWDAAFYTRTQAVYEDEPC